MSQQPSVGRVVHYQSLGSTNGEYLPEPRAAIITEIGGSLGEKDSEVQLVGLCVLNPTGLFFNRDVPFAEEPTSGHWNWPPRTEERSAVVTEVDRFYQLGLAQATEEFEAYTQPEEERKSSTLGSAPYWTNYDAIDDGGDDD